MNIYPRITLIVLLIFFILNCRKNEIGSNEEEDELQILLVIPDPLRERAEELVSSMDDSTLIAQLIITGIDGRGHLPPHMKTLLEEIPAGGVMLFRYNLDTNNETISTLINETSLLITNNSGIAPFIAVDFEGGSVNRFAGNRELPAASSLPDAYSYWELFLLEEKTDALVRIRQDNSVRNEINTLSKIREDALIAGREIAALGINMNFAPIAETLNDDNRAFLYSRSYGHDPVFAAEACASFFYGMREAGILCVVKHFPGSAGVDPHHEASVLNFKIDASWKTDLNLASYIYPFSNLFSRGARAVMVAHTLIPAIDNKIASLSSIVMNDWLRSELGFDGIIIADDFFMAAAGDMPPEQTSVLSVAAGADMVIVWQHNLRRTYDAFKNALEDGTLSRERLRQAASNIIYEKLRMGLIN